jgi:beta-lactam-binding protein with PASTA domain
MFKYITRKPLWFNILVAIGMVLAVFLIFFLLLEWITRHGESSSVPAVTGKNIIDVTRDLEDKGFEVVIQDSVYYDSLPPGVVIKQVPEPDAVVKKNRTVYVTVNRFVAPDIDMPNLVGYSFRNAELVLINSGLKLGDTTYKMDFAKNSVLEQLFRGQNIKAGTKIKVGSTIDLVLSSGVGDIAVPVPKVTGLTYAEARSLLDASGFIVVPYADPDVRDSAAAFVYRQNPAPKTEDGFQVRIRQGQLIEVWLGTTPPVTDSTRNEPQNPDDDE